jgi:hypothetical protein
MIITTLCLTTHCIKDQNGVSSIMSTPSTKMIESVISSFFTNTNLTPDEVQIVVGFDKRIGRDIDDEYRKNLEIMGSRFPNFKLILNESSSIEAIVTATQNFKNVIFSVETETYMIFEHDRPLISYLDVRPIIEEMQINENINYIRFNEFDNNNDRYFNLVENGYNPSNNIPLIQTFRWSNTPHICKTKTFRNWFSTFVYPTHNQGGFVEGPLNELISFYMEKIGQDEALRRFGTYVYGKWNDPAITAHIGSSHNGDIYFLRKPGNTW